MVNYHNRYIPNLSSLLQPLTALLQKGKKWTWSTSCEQAFHLVKSKLACALILAYYDPCLSLCMAADASSYGVGVVLTQIMMNGEEWLVAFASRTMLSTEWNYSQLEQEALAIIFAIKKFRQYIYGQHFVLLTNHQLLMTILSPKKGIPTMVAAQLQCWAIILASYSYTMEFKYSKDNVSVDALSRLPCPVNDKEEETESAFYINDLHTLPVTAKQLAIAT